MNRVLEDRGGGGEEEEGEREVEENVKEDISSLNKKRKYFMLKASNQKSFEDSYRNNQWNSLFSIKQKIRNEFFTSIIYGIVVINGSRHFHGYFLIEDDSRELSLLEEEEAKRKVIFYSIILYLLFSFYLFVCLFVCLF